MTWQFTPYAVPLAASTIVTVALAVYAWRHREAPGAPAFALLMAAVAEWCATGVLQVLGADVPTKLLWTKTHYLGIVLVPVAWLAFALQYTGHGSWLTRRNLVVLCALPAATLALVLTNDHHGLFWSRVGPPPDPGAGLSVTRGAWFWVNVGYSYLLLLAGTIVMLPRLLGSPEVYRGQAAALLAGLAIPWASNAAFVFRARLMSHDPTPFALTLSGLAFAWGLFRYRLLDVVPVARDAVIEVMSDGMMVLDRRGRVVDLNPAAQRILGCTPGEAVGRPAAQVLSAWPDLLERYRDAVSAQAEVSLGEGAAERHFQLRISPLLDRRGRSTGRLLVWSDVTERKRAEADLRAQKQLFENLLAVARATTERPSLDATLQNTLDVASSLTEAEGASLFLLDESGAVTHSLVTQGQQKTPHRFEFIRPIMEKGVAGWVARERKPALIADTLEDGRWLDLKDEGRPVRSVLSVPISSGERLVGILTLVHERPGHFGEEHQRFIRAAGDQLALALRNAQIFDERTRLARRQTTLYEVLRAVGGQLDPEKVARAAVEAIARHTRWPNVVIARLDAGGRRWTFETVSRYPILMEALPAGRGVIGRAYASGRTQLVPDVSADPDYVAGLPAMRSELAVPVKRGERTLAVLNLESDRPAAFGPEEVQLAESFADAVALALDNAQLYRDIADKHARLVALETMRDDLTHTMVHDLRSPLTSVAGVLEALDLTATGTLSRTQREMVKVARAGAGRMSALVDAILEVSRLESGSVPLVRQALDLAPLVAEALELQAPLAGEKKLRLAKDVPPAQPPAWADRGLVSRVLQNLVGNAVKFTPEGGRVGVSVELQATEPPMLRVSVTDTGPGIPHDLKGRLFQKFVTGKQPDTGTGLGLAFCRLAVEAHGGRIWLEGDSGPGSTFRFTLPTAGPG